MRVALGVVGGALVVTGCGLLPGAGSTPPLAVERTDQGMEALSHGTLEIEGPCAWIVAGRDRWLLVWPADRATWDAVTAEVVFTHRDGTVKRLHDGQEIALGGGASNREDGAAFAQVDWVAAPPAQCDTDTRWHVSSVVLP